MAAGAGRAVGLTWNSAAILGVREKGFTLNGEPINVTSDEDGGWQTILAAPGEKAVNISLSGVTKDRTLKTDFFAGNTTRAVVLTYPDGSTIAGNFFLASYKEGVPYNDAITFDAELQSTGAIVWTPGA